MNFAQKILKKYGWKEGDGLGKSRDGIAKPLKASLKFDNAGLGVDKADEFNNHWWERVFNEAANNVDFKSDGDNISVKVKNKDSVEITTKSYSVRELKKKQHDLYGNFLSSAVLTNTGNEVRSKDRIEIDDITVSVPKPLTDEELFAACGGRTAHKGARHGLKLSGKLARLEKQENELLKKMENNVSGDNSTTWTVVKSKKKKRAGAKDEAKQNEDATEEDPIRDALYITEYHIKSKKKRKEKKKTEENLSGFLDSCSLNNNIQKELFPGVCDTANVIEKKKGKKLKNRESVELNKFREQSTNNACFNEPGNERTEAEKTESSKDIHTHGEVTTAENEHIEKKKKSKKCKHGIDKEAKEAYKRAKKVRKHLKHITELEHSVLPSM